MRRWRANNPHISSFAQLKTNANKRGIPFQLSLAEFRTFCDATGYIDKRGRFVGNFHVDRIDSLRGYEASNIQLLSATENCGVKATREKYALQRLRQQGIDCELTRRYAELDEQQQPYNEFLDYELENIDAPF